jgi:hypothetical protein
VGEKFAQGEENTFDISLPHKDYVHVFERAMILVVKDWVDGFSLKNSWKSMRSN